MDAADEERHRLHTQLRPRCRLATFNHRAGKSGGERPGPIPGQSNVTRETERGRVGAKGARQDRPESGDGGGNTRYRLGQK